MSGRIVYSGGIDVEALPRRVAHVVHALMEVRNDVTIGPYGPYKASEIILYDGESLSTQQTGAALREARQMGLAESWGRGLWSASVQALANRQAFETRYMRDTEEAEGTDRA